LKTLVKKTWFCFPNYATHLGSIQTFISKSIITSKTNNLIYHD